MCRVRRQFGAPEHRLGWWRENGRGVACAMIRDSPDLQRTDLADGGVKLDAAGHAPCWEAVRTSRGQVGLMA